MHLTGKCEHVGEEARVQNRRGIDPLRFNMGLGLVKERPECVQADLEYRN
jgi:hypothetical protein